MVILLRLVVPLIIILVIVGFLISIVAKEIKNKKALEEKKYQEEIKERDILRKKLDEK